MNNELNTLAVAFVATFLNDDKSRWAMFKTLTLDLGNDAKAAGAECRKALTALNTIKGVDKLNASTTADVLAANPEKDFSGKANKTIRNYTWVISKAIDLKINYSNLAYTQLEKKVTEVSDKTKTPKPIVKTDAAIIDQPVTQATPTPRAGDELTVKELKAHEAQKAQDAIDKEQSGKQAIKQVLDAQVTAGNVHTMPIDKVTSLYNMIKHQRLNRVELLELIDRLDVLADDLQEQDSIAM